MLALGLGGSVAGVAVLVIGGLTALWNGLLIGGLLLVAIGGALVTSAARSRGVDREKALRSLSDAQRRLNQIKMGRTEAEVDLNEMCRKMGYRDPVELMREWGEWVRLMEDSAPVLRAQEGILALEAQRKTVLDEVRELVERVGGGSPDPANLERVAASIRQHWAIRQRLDDLEQSWSWIDDEKRVTEAAATGLKERAVRILQSAGLPYDPDRPWVEHVHELSSRLQDKSRHTLLKDELIPQAERRLLSEEALEDKKRELELLEADHAEALAEGEAPDRPRSQSEIEAKVRTIRDHLESVQKWRADLRIGVEEAWRRHRHEHPEKVAELDRLDDALRRARRFQRATDLARETIQKVAVSTHRRWAEHLNQRVTEVLQAVGTGISEVRFGDDLDFSVRYTDGRQVARGKAMLQMSSGALDQLHLAVRLAVSEYLSRGDVSMPLLVDDAFATSDDERTEAAMRLLIEHFAQQHQVLVVTCHRSRFDALAAADPDLFEGVQRIELAQPAGTAG
jgi:DNA repair exonuclease SbcCD ATPase subunit